MRKHFTLKRTQSKGEGEETGDDNDVESEPEDLVNSGEDSEHNDMPEYELEEGEKQVMDPDYVFCPEVHHWQILQKFTKHLCQHLFFLTSSGTYQTSSEICCTCVYDMYTFCCDHSLRPGHIYGTPGTAAGISGPDHLVKLIYHESIPQ